MAFDLRGLKKKHQDRKDNPYNIMNKLYCATIIPIAICAWEAWTLRKKEKSRKAPKKRLSQHHS